jgi:EAL domain-containing protein (putative c-di-GMP-specific phosphodiesterase class I)
METVQTILRLTQNGTTFVVEDFGTTTAYFTQQQKKSIQVA